MPERVIAPLLRFAYRRRALIALGGLAIAIVCVPLIARIRFDSNVLNLLPRRGPAVQAFQAYLSRFGTLDKLYILFEVDEEHSISDAAALVDAYVDELRRAPEIAHVDADVIAPDKDWSYLFNRELLLLTPDARREALARFDPARMDAQLARARESLSVSSADVKAMVQT